jgi:Ran GTPase-activating protein (RanGAP) involved in mRNA processing and transport
MASAVAPIQPISVPTDLGAREVLDIGATTLNLQNLEDPKTSHHQCASRFGAQAVRSIFEKLAGNDQVSTFEELNLSDNNIGDAGAEWLLKGLTGKTSTGEPVGKNLKVLLMPRARMGVDGMKAIGQVIGASSSLENVILSSNNCGAEGVKGEFAAGLSKNQSIKSLCIAACRLGDDGVSGLCKGPLRNHPKLEHISFAYNRLGVAAAQSLAAAMAVNKALRFLDLSGNSLGPVGAEALVEGLKKNGGRVQQISVAQNEIKHQGAKAFCDFFMSPAGKSLIFCDLRHNAVQYKAMVQLREELGLPMTGPEGWMLVFGDRQLLLNR